MSKYSYIVLPRRHAKRMFIRGMLLGAFVGVMSYTAINRPVTATPQCPDRQEIIIDYFAEVIHEIHGNAYRPDLMPPERKPMER